MIGALIVLDIHNFILFMAYFWVNPCQGFSHQLFTFILFSAICSLMFMLGSGNRVHINYYQADPLTMSESSGKYDITEKLSDSLYTLGNNKTQHSILHYLLIYE